VVWKVWRRKIQHGFAVNTYCCVYSKLIGSDCVIVCFYVDDMLIFGTNVHVVHESKKLLSSHFENKHTRETDAILGIKIWKTNDGFSLYQSHYIEKILKKFNCFDATSMRTPYDPSIYCKKNKGSNIFQT